MLKPAIGLIRVTRYHGDLNETYPVGNVDEKHLQLIKGTYESLEKSIAIGKARCEVYNVGMDSYP